MAVDFSLLPGEAPLPENAPSRLVWTVVFFVLFVATMFAVLMLWPANIETRTPQFWIALAVLPFCVASLVVLRRYSAYEAQRLEVLERNEVSRQYNQRVFDAASKPLAVVAIACRISANESKKMFQALLENTLKLETQQSVAQHDKPVKARWLSVPGITLRSGDATADHVRQRKVIAWVFTELLSELNGAIQGLPLGVDIVVQFAVSSVLTVEERDVLWIEAWQRYASRTMRVDAVEPTVILNALDVWLDDLIEAPEQHARLVVAIQLHPLLSDTPPEGSAEAAVALLLMPDSLARKHAINHQAKLHRPVRSTLENAHDALMPALKWANASGDEIADSWQTGFNDTTKGHLIKPLNAFGVTRKPIDLDGSVGYAGVAAPWLAVACASAALSAERPLQLVLSGTPENVDCAVLRRPLANPASVKKQTIE